MRLNDKWMSEYVKIRLEDVTHVQNVSEARGISRLQEITTNKILYAMFESDKMKKLKKETLNSSLHKLWHFATLKKLKIVSSKQKYLSLLVYSLLLIVKALKADLYQAVCCLKLMSYIYTLVHDHDIGLIVLHKSLLAANMQELVMCQVAHTNITVTDILVCLLLVSN